MEAVGVGVVMVVLMMVVVVGAVSLPLSLSSRAAATYYTAGVAILKAGQPTFSRYRAG